MSHVRCRFCRKIGHNITGCPAYKQNIEELRAVHGDSHYSVANYDRKKANRSKKIEDKSCSYCDVKGHTRRTCEMVSEHKNTVRDLTLLYRKAFLVNISQSGTGVGSILSHKDRWNLDSPPTLQVVKSYNIKNLGIWFSWSYACNVLDMSKGKVYEDQTTYGLTGESHNFVERRHFSSIDSEYSYSTVVSRSEKVPKNIEEGLEEQLTNEFSSKGKNFVSSWRTKNIISSYESMLSRRQKIEEDFNYLPSA